jgi:hypothetical protein
MGADVWRNDTTVSPRRDGSFFGASSCEQPAYQCPALSAAIGPSHAIVGDWKPTDMDVDIRIFPKDGKYVGGVIKATNPALVNTELLREIQFDAATGTWRGEMFALKRGEFVPMTIKMTANGFEMVASAGFMSKTVEWVRVQYGGGDPGPPVPG